MSKHSDGFRGKAGSIVILTLITGLGFFELLAAAVAPERLSRGLVAFPKGGGQIFLGWRLLESDNPSEGFNVFRAGNSGGPYEGPVNGSPITTSTNYIDNGTSTGTTYYYIVKDEEGNSSNEVRITASSSGSNHLTIPSDAPGMLGLGGRRAVAGDLTGDGNLDIVMADQIDTDGDNSYDAFYLNAYDVANNRKLWRVFLSHPGAAVDDAFLHGYGALTVWDLDGDGSAEVYAVMISTDASNQQAGQIVKFDGASGSRLDSTAMPSRYYTSYNQSLLGIIFINDQPHLVVMCGPESDRLKLACYDRTLTKVWEWQSSANEDASGGHYLSILDIDGDNNDEILCGSVLINDDGTTIWQQNRGNCRGAHVDIADMGDFDPNRPGYEVWYGDCRTIYDVCKFKAEVYLIDLESNQTIWADDWDNEGSVQPGDRAGRPYMHIHGGSVADVDPKPGVELVSWDDYGSIPRNYDLTTYPVTDNVRPQFVMDINNNYLYYDQSYDNMAFNSPVQFDDDDQWEVVRYNGYGLNRSVLAAKYNGAQVFSLDFADPGVEIDLFGDFREEYIAFAPDNSAFYVISNTNLSSRRKVTMLQDRGYRTGHVRMGSGYTHSTLPSGKSFSVQAMDNTPPTISKVTATGKTSVVVNFSESVNSSTAGNAGNYSIDQGIGAPSSALASGSSVTLTVSGLACNGSYLLTVNNVQDQNGNTIASNSQRSFSGPYCDVTPPTLLSAAAYSVNTVTVVFSETLDQVSAESEANYSLDKGILISTATLQPNKKNVNLALTGNLTEGTQYTVTVSNVADDDGNVIVANSQVSFTFTNQLPDLQISNLSPAGAQTGVLTAGVTYYSDRAFTVTTLPSALIGATIIKTLNDDKGNCSATYLSFDINRDAEVIVAWQKDIPEASWLTGGGFSLTGETIVTDQYGPMSFNLYTKTFSSGSMVSLGGVCAAAYTNYFVVVKPLGGTGIDGKIVERLTSPLSVFPNPFSGETNIEYMARSAEKLILTVHNVEGRQVRQWVNENARAGNYAIRWDGRDDQGRPVKSGIYWVQLETGHGTKTMSQKILLLK